MTLYVASIAIPTVIKIMFLNNYYAKETLELIKVGNDGAVCVKDESGYGVVHQGEKGILCATCRFNKRACPHVVKVASAISEQQRDVPGFLVPLSRALCAEATKTKEHRAPLASLQSFRRIPFKFTPALASVLKLAFSDRFQIVEGVCQLSESDAPSCSLCGHSEWDAGCPQSTVLVTQHQTLAGCGKCSIRSRYYIADEPIIQCIPNNVGMLNVMEKYVLMGRIWDY